MVFSSRFSAVWLSVLCALMVCGSARAEQIYVIEINDPITPVVAEFIIRSITEAEQDRSRWDQELIAEGTALVTAAMSTGAIGEYQLQAANQTA